MRLGPSLTTLLLTSATRRHCQPQSAFSDDSLEALRQEQRAFVDERDWSQFHTPRSLSLALVSEVGELCELFQWRGDVGSPPGLPEWTPQERTALSEELADVLSYVIRLADVTEIDLPAAFLQKMAKNRAKYPADLVRGSAAKYTEYRRQEASAPTPSSSTTTDNSPSAELDPWQRAQARVEAQNRAYARAQKRAADKWATLKGGGGADAPRSDGTGGGAAADQPAGGGGSWAQSAALPASEYTSDAMTRAANVRERAAARADALLEARATESVGLDGAQQTEAPAEAPEEAAVEAKEAAVEAAAEAATEEAKVQKAEPLDAVSRSTDAPLLEVESLDELWGLIDPY